MCAGRLTKPRCGSLDGDLGKDCRADEVESVGGDCVVMAVDKGGADGAKRLGGIIGSVVAGVETGEGWVTVGGGWMTVEGGGWVTVEGGGRGWVSVRGDRGWVIVGAVLTVGVLGVLVRMPVGHAGILKLAVVDCKIAATVADDRAGTAVIEAAAVEGGVFNRGRGRGRVTARPGAAVIEDSYGGSGGGGGGDNRGRGDGDA